MNPPDEYNELVEEFNRTNQGKICENLKLKDLPGEEIPNNPADFLYLFLTKWNFLYKTVDGEISNHIVTRTNKSRSINEIFYLVKSYYPDYDLKSFFADVYEYFYRCNIENKTSYMFNCGDIRRTVLFYKGENHGGGERESITTQFPYEFIYKRYTDINCGYALISKIPHYLYKEVIIKYIVGDKYKNKDKILN